MYGVVCKLTLLAIVLLAYMAYASEPDVVVLRSKNRMSRTVKSLNRGKLDFSIEGADSLEIA